MPTNPSSIRRDPPLRAILLGLAVVLVVGLWLKIPCASDNWSNGQTYTGLCYSDIFPLYRLEGLADGKFPYFDAPNEYPVGLGMLMEATALPVSSEGSFLLLNAAVLALAALVATLLLYRMAGRRALYFALAPTLLLTAFLNWDLVPVALATAGTFAYLHRRDTISGLLLGAGAVAKVFPGYLVVPFGLGREHEGRRGDALRLAAAAAGIWILANAPFMLLTPNNWSWFFRFNAKRPIDWATLWFVACHHMTGSINCGNPNLYSALSLIAFVVGSVLVWRWKVARDPAFARWTFGFPVLIVFLLTAKVYSPQYSLWLLPWFALVLPNFRLFVAFEVTDVAAYITVFSWIGRHLGLGGLPIGFLEVAVLVRAAVLVACLVTWVRTEGSRQEAHREVVPEPVGR